MGKVEPGAKVVLWSETRTPIQTWSAKLSGSITSLTFPGLLLDVKGKLERGMMGCWSIYNTLTAHYHKLQVAIITEVLVVKAASTGSGTNHLCTVGGGIMQAISFYL